jgi:hypothetical protein
MEIWIREQDPLPSLHGKLKSGGTSSIPNYNTFVIFTPKFNHSPYSKNLCKHSQIKSFLKNFY